MELAKNGGILMDDAKWEELALSVNLPPKILPRVLRSWEEGDSDHAPQLIQRDGDLFTLSDEHILERNFIEANGKYRLQQSAAGKRSRASKARKKGKS